MVTAVSQKTAQSVSPQPWSWMGGPNGFIIDAHGAPQASTSVNQGRGPAHFSSAAAMMGAAVRGDGAYVSDAGACVL